MTTRNWKKLSKDEINNFPLKKYHGPVKVIQSLEQAAEAVRQLKDDKILGFDTETRPAFTKGEKYSPALIQLCGTNKVFIFQIKKIGLPNILKNILTDPEKVKAGVSINFDIAELQKVSYFEPAGFVDLADSAKGIGIKNHGLRGLAAVLLGFRISKGPNTTNWEKAQLTPAQISYAATDAWVGRELYLRLKELKTEPFPIPCLQFKSSIVS